jgi:hypothetical protein
LPAIDNNARKSPREAHISLSNRDKEQSGDEATMDLALSAVFAFLLNPHGGLAITVLVIS